MVRNRTASRPMRPKALPPTIDTKAGLDSRTLARGRSSGSRCVCSGRMPRVFKCDPVWTTHRRVSYDSRTTESDGGSPTNDGEVTVESVRDPKTPIDCYKAIIDMLVNEVRLRGAGHQVSERGVFSQAPAHQEFNRLIGSLSQDQRTLVAEMLQDERHDAIHDVLSTLTWWIITRGVGITFQGLVMPVDVSGGGLHGDYVGRCQGWQWPDKPEPSTR